MWSWRSTPKPQEKSSEVPEKTPEVVPETIPEVIPDIVPEKLSEVVANKINETIEVENLMIKFKNALETTPRTLYEIGECIRLKPEFEDIANCCNLPKVCLKIGSNYCMGRNLWVYLADGQIEFFNNPDYKYYELVSDEDRRSDIPKELLEFRDVPSISRENFFQKEFVKFRPHCKITVDGNELIPPFVLKGSYANNGVYIIAVYKKDGKYFEVEPIVNPDKLTLY